MPPECPMSLVPSSPEISSHLDCPNLQTYSCRCQNVATIPELAAPPTASESSDPCPPVYGLDFPIALQKGKRSYTSHPISNLFLMLMYLMCFLHLLPLCLKFLSLTLLQRLFHIPG